jgi:SNF2 family DNA or RNA helicase
MVAGVHAELTADGSSIVLAFTGDDFDLDAAAKALKRLTALTEPTDPPSGMRTVAATWANVTQLAHTFNSGTLGYWLPRPRLREWITQEFLRRCDPGQLRTGPGVPGRDDLLARVYQVDAARMIGAIGKFLLFDDPGVGKTVSALLGLREREARGHDIFPVVIVVPSWDVGDVWARHIAEWCPSWPEPVMHGGPARNVLRWEPGVLITTYATMRRDAADARGPLVRLRAKTVVADEVHLAKNPESKQSLALRRVAKHAGTVVALTGTPITRDTGDIYPVLQAMDPASWPNKGQFTKRYLDTHDNGYGEKVEGLKALAEPEFRAVLAGQYRRCAKADVLSQLPPKVYSVRRIEIPPAWRKAYDSMQQDMLAELPDGEELPVMSVLAQLTRLGQLAASACDVTVTYESDPETGELRKRYDVQLKAPSWKANALLGVLAERPGQQTAVFTVSKQLADIAGTACAEAGYRCGYITGGQSKASRRHDIDAFQAGELDVIVATAGAGSLGITLTRASTGVFLQRSWQLDQAIQPEDRMHRLDDIVMKHEQIEIIDVVAKDTVDERVRELMRVKGGHLGQLVQDPRIVRGLLGGLK